jgi:Glycosyl hydrolase family 26
MRRLLRARARTAGLPPVALILAGALPSVAGAAPLTLVPRDGGRLDARITAGRLARGFDLLLDGRRVAQAGSERSWVVTSRTRRLRSYRSWHVLDLRRRRSQRRHARLRFAITRPSAPRAPTIVLMAAPPDLAKTGTGRFAFLASSGSTSCSLDGRAFRPCSSPVTYTGLPSGTHRFTVRAVNRAGSSKVSASWSILPIPDSTPTPTASATPLAPEPLSPFGPSPIYWGAFMDGDQTYNHLYGGSWGDAPWDPKTWDKFESNAGKKLSIVHYHQPPPWAQAFAAHPANVVTGRGGIPLIDMSSRSVPLADLANGAYDTSLAAWAQAAKAWGKPFFLRWNWEMNGTWFSWGAQARQDPAAFVAAWRHFHDVVSRVGATNITWTWCPNTEWVGSTPYEQLYPGDAYVDWTCLDGYNKGATSESFAALFQQSYSHLLRLAPSKPIMIGETASREYEPDAKAAWIADLLQTLPATLPRIKALVWFNWRINESAVWWDWPIESSASAQRAFAQGIASPYYASGGPGPLEPLSKVPEP